MRQHYNDMGAPFAPEGTDMATENLMELQKEQQELTAALRRDYSQETIAKLAALQTRLREAQKAEDAKADVSAEDASITLIRGGKDDQTLVVPAGTTLAAVLDQLGWSEQGFEFKRMLGAGLTEQVKSAKTAVLGAGVHEIFMSPKVVGG